MIAGKDYGAGDWSPAELTMLREMWADGRTAGQISAALSKVGPGRSRSSVIGKSRRLELVRRPSPIKGVVTATPKPRSKPKPASIAAPTVSTPEPPPTVSPGAVAGVGAATGNAAPAPSTSLRQRLIAMAPRAPHRTCQWPMNNGAPWQFCGCARWEGTRMPYCEEHALKARAKPREEEDAA